MNKSVSIHHSLVLAKKFKPLFIAIPLSALVACANQQETPPPSTPDAYQQQTTQTPFFNEESSNDLVTETYKRSTAYETPGPDLTDPVSGISEDNQFENSGSDKAHENSPVALAESSAKDLPSDSIPGEDPMATLVIEDPGTLAQLSQNYAKDNIPLTTLKVIRTVQKPSKRVFHFGFNQTQLSDEDIEVIEKHAAYLKANPTLQVTVHGHTDNQGHSDYNLKLSQHRAEMVVSQLEKNGIDQSRIKSVSWGGGYPLINTLHFAENRRIEIEYSEITVAANQ